MTATEELNAKIELEKQMKKELKEKEKELKEKEYQLEKLRMEIYDIEMKGYPCKLRSIQICEHTEHTLVELTIIKLDNNEECTFKTGISGSVCSYVANCTGKRIDVTHIFDTILNVEFIYKQFEGLSTKDGKSMKFSREFFGDKYVHCQLGDKEICKFIYESDQSQMFEKSGKTKDDFCVMSVTCNMYSIIREKFNVAFASNIRYQCSPETYHIWALISDKEKIKEISDLAYKRRRDYHQ